MFPGRFVCILTSGEPELREPPSTAGPRSHVGVPLDRETKVAIDMGDKNPKAQQKQKKQGDAQKSQAKEAHDKKQAPPAPAGKGKGK